MLLYINLPGCDCNLSTTKYPTATLKIRSKNFSGERKPLAAELLMLEFALFLEEGAKGFRFLPSLLRRDSNTLSGATG